MFSILKRYKELPLGILLLHIFGKTLGGFGIGVLLVVYVKSDEWVTWGWVAIVVSILVQLPALIKIVSKKAAEKALKNAGEETQG